MEKILLVAVGQNGEMGKGDGLPWPKLPSDFRQFKRLTLGHPVIMGRKTYESIVASLGRPLPRRTSIVLSRDNGFNPNQSKVVAVSEMEAAMDFAQQAFGSEKIFFIGGVSVYQEALERGLIDKMMITRVQGEFADADVFFPEVNWHNWTLSGKISPPEDEENPLDMIFEVYEPMSVV